MLILLASISTNVFGYEIAKSFQYPVLNNLLYNSSSQKGWTLVQDFQDCRSEVVPAGITPCRHLGEDWFYYDDGWKSQERIIRSIANGYVVKSGVKKGFSGYIIMKHYLSEYDESDYVLSIYGHLTTKNLPAKGAYYAKGKKLSSTASVFEMKKYTTFDPHLHLEIRKPRSVTGFSDTYLNDGYAYSSGNYYDPTDLPYWETTQDINGEEGYVESHHNIQTSFKAPYFDGTGSLIDPQNTECPAEGCDNDYVELHPHVNQTSAGFFQVFKVPNVCEAIKLENLGEASVEVRSWAGRGENSKYYDVNDYFSTVPLTSNAWSLVAFKTKRPIKETQRVHAVCLRSRIAIAPEVSGTPLQFENDNYWGGNGSIIGHSDNQFNGDTIAGYGRTQDTVVIFEDKKALSGFQVTKSESCEKIKFETPVSFNLSWKFWNEKDWRGSRTIRNNDIFTLPSDGYWWILKVKAPPARNIDVDKLRINAICQSS